MKRTHILVEECVICEVIVSRSVGLVQVFVYLLCLPSSQLTFVENGADTAIWFQAQGKRSYVSKFGYLAINICLAHSNLTVCSLFEIPLTVALGQSIQLFCHLLPPSVLLLSHVLHAHLRIVAAADDLHVELAHELPRVGLYALSVG